MSAHTEAPPAVLDATQTRARLGVRGKPISHAKLAELVDAGHLRPLPGFDQYRFAVTEVERYLRGGAA